MKKMPVGISDFRELIESKLYYIDKTLLIKDLLDNGSKVNLIVRPRRFGKTINMSMLKYYFDKSEEDNSMLFENLDISKYPEYKQHQGKYPVIFITLKDIKCNTWEETYLHLQSVIQSQFVRHYYLIHSSKLSEFEKKYIQSIFDKNASSIDYVNSLLNLTYYLFKHYNIRPIVLIDDYNIPLRYGFINNFYSQVEDFICNWLSGGLKDNTYIEFAVLIGPLRIPKGDIFDDLDNLELFSISDKRYREYFGFTESEIHQIANDFGCEEKLKEIKEWYGGYNFTGLEIYSPLSVSNYIYENCKPESYLFNVSSNSIIHDLVHYSNIALKQDLEILLRGEKLKVLIDTNIDYSDIQKSNYNLYSFLVLTGYLTIFDSKEFINKTFYNLSIPNKEIAYIYQHEILSQFINGLCYSTMYNILKALLYKDIINFKIIFQDLMLKTLSHINNFETLYQDLVLALVALLVDTHYVKSNRESGYGRFDVMLIPKDKALQGIILEFKAADKKDDLQSKAKKALQQIDHKKYETELQELSIKEIYRYGIAFCGKDIEIISK